MTAVLRRGRGALGAAAGRFLRAATLILLFYLLQAVVMPHLKVFGVMPNLLMVLIAILTVSYGKLFAFISSATIGIMLESMARTIPLFYVLIYPVLGLVCAQLFADMTDIQREYRRIRDAQRQNETVKQLAAPFMKGRLRLRLRRDTSRDVNAHLRILLNALLLCVLYDGIMLVYIALRGIPVTGTHLLRTFWSLAYTAVCCLMMFPARAFLGLYRRKRPGALRERISTDEALLRRMVLVPDDAPAPTQKKKFLGLFGGRASAPRAEAPQQAESNAPPPAEDEDDLDIDPLNLDKEDPDEN
ncbi:MAG TPA: hypothetical protein VLA21_09675 [Candidatus Limnocylindria bacterium]|nr:hypothetical protein [Candidatus Limnocylindria bacterium]